MTADPVAEFLASKPELHLSVDVYGAEKAFADVVEKMAAIRPSCPQLGYRQTPDQLDPDAREVAVEAVLTAAGDYDDMPLAITVLSALRPDLDRVDLLNEIHHLYELSDETFRANARGDRRLAEHFADRYEVALCELARAAVVTR